MFRAGPGVSSARVPRFPTPATAAGRERYLTLRANPQGDRRRRPDLTPLPPPRVHASRWDPSCRRSPDPPWGRPSTADNLGHLRNPPRGQPLLVESMFAIGLRPTTTTLANAAAERPGAFGVRSALLKDNKFLQRFSWVVQGRRAARRPSGRRPSRFPCLRVPRTERALSKLAPAAASNPLHRYQTEGDAHEATRSGRARPGGPGPQDPRTSRPGEQPGLTF